MLELLARRGFQTEVLSASEFEVDHNFEITAWLQSAGYAFEEVGGIDVTRLPQPLESLVPAHVRLTVGGVPISIHKGRTSRNLSSGDAERNDVLRLLGATLERFKPDIVAASGTGVLVRDVLEKARSFGIATVLFHDFRQRDPAVFSHADVLLSPTALAAEFHREIFGIESTVLPPPVDLEKARAERTPGLQYVTFVDPTLENGALVFTRIAEVLGRRRPDIPLLVVQGRGTEVNLAQTGVDLSAHGNVHVMPRVRDNREFWMLTRICLLPNLLADDVPLPALEALANGAPIVSSNRGVLSEVLASAALALPLPDRLTGATRLLPTAEEVTPWVDWIIRLWDERALFDDLRRKSLAEARRWSPRELEPRYAEFVQSIQAGSGPSRTNVPNRAKMIVLVPHLNGIERECEEGLRWLEALGIRVARRVGSSAIDVARNEMISDALHQGYESMMFIDSDIGFDPQDVLRLFARPEPVATGVYAKKATRGIASEFHEGIDEVLFGPECRAPYPLQYAATGFMRIKAGVLRKMIEELKLPLCNTKWGQGNWPFFWPMIVPHEEERLHYLGEDWSFSYRLRQIGVTPVADTSIRLWHWGRYGYSWEDAGSDVARYRAYRYRFQPQ
jgi:glycosyltransferase involved in cell wall biosynthesis